MVLGMSATDHLELPRAGFVYLTVSKILQVKQLIVPLCDYSDRIFNEGNHDQETPYGRKVSSDN